MRRSHIEYTDLLDFDFRDYHDGLMNGARMQRPWLIKDLRVGTVTLQAMHLAAILGARKIHTIGYDLCYREFSRDHWYNYPPYKVDGRFWKSDPTAEFAGWKTNWLWVDTAHYLTLVKPLLRRQGIEWFDHSNGLLATIGLHATSSIRSA